MRAASLSAVVVVACASVARGQTVEFRIVERTAQAQVSPVDPVLDLAVQARFNGANSLGGFYFDMRMLAEQEARGTLEYGAISNLDGTYDPAFGVGGSVGRHGLARSYSYFATVNPNFLGMINQSAGTFTNTPDQEIGLVTAFAQGVTMLGTPGMDTNSDGNPDTWSGNGSGMIPTNLATASLDPAISAAYFAHNEFVDVYRFRYTVTDFAVRTLQFRLLNIVAQQFTQLVYSGGQWGAQNSTTPTTAIVSSGLNIAVVPAPAIIGLLGAGMMLAARRRR